MTVELGAAGVVDLVEIDTSYFVGNAPGWASLTGLVAGPGGSTLGTHAEVLLAPRARLQPDTRHHFRVTAAQPVSRVRLDVFPDGGVARLRVLGRLTDASHEAAVSRWLDLLPGGHARQVLRDDARLDADAAAELLSRRPFSGTETLPPEVVRALRGGRG